LREMCVEEKIKPRSLLRRWQKEAEAITRCEMTTDVVPRVHRGYPEFELNQLIKPRRRAVHQAPKPLTVLMSVNSLWSTRCDNGRGYLSEVRAHTMGVQPRMTGNARLPFASAAYQPRAWQHQTGAPTRAARILSEMHRLRSETRGEGDRDLPKIITGPAKTAVCDTSKPQP